MGRLLLILLLIVTGVGGCLPLQSAYSRRGSLPKLNPFGLRSVASEDKVVVRYLLLDRPLGDPFLRTKLWNTTLQPLTAEQAALLSENGLRVGQFPSNPPAELLDMLSQSDAVLQPHEVTLTADQEKILAVNGPVPESRYRYRSSIGAEPVLHERKNAQFGIAIAVTPDPDSGLNLRFEPITQHGEKQGWLRTTSDETGFSWLDQKQTERPAGLMSNMRIQPGEFVVIGPTEQPSERAGGAWFVATNTDNPRMRVLVLRAWPAPVAATATVPGQKTARAK